MQKACAYDVRKALIRDLLISIHKTRGFEWQTAHTKGCLEDRCVDSLFTSVGAGEASILDVSSWSTFDNLCSPGRKTDSYLALLKKDKICPAVTLVKVAFILHRQVKI